jgi:hypothetical protein
MSSGLGLPRKRTLTEQGKESKSRGRPKKTRRKSTQDGDLEVRTQNGILPIFMSRENKNKYRLYFNNKLPFSLTVNSKSQYCSLSFYNNRVHTDYIPNVLEKNQQMLVTQISQIFEDISSRRQCRPIQDKFINFVIKNYPLFFQNFGFIFDDDKCEVKASNCTFLSSSPESPFCENCITLFNKAMHLVRRLQVSGFSHFLNFMDVCILVQEDVKICKKFSLEFDLSSLIIKGNSLFFFQSPSGEKVPISLLFQIDSSCTASVYLPPRRSPVFLQNLSDSNEARKFLATCLSPGICPGNVSLYDQVMGAFKSLHENGQNSDITFERLKSAIPSADFGFESCRSDNCPYFLHDFQGCKICELCNTESRKVKRKLNSYLGRNEDELIQKKLESTTSYTSVDKLSPYSSSKRLNNFYSERKKMIKDNLQLWKKYEMNLSIGEKSRHHFEFIQAVNETCQEQLEEEFSEKNDPWGNKRELWGELVEGCCCYNGFGDH